MNEKLGVKVYSTDISPSYPQLPGQLMTLPREKSLLKTYNDFVDELKEKQEDKSEPLYICSNSLSAPLALKLVKQREPGFFDGCLLVNPVF